MKRIHGASRIPAGTLLLLCLLALPAQGCGFLGTEGEEPTGESNLPLSGVGPYFKEDQDCQTEFIQPLFMSSGSPDTFWGEPFAVPVGRNRLDLWFEARTGESVRVLFQPLLLERAGPTACRRWNIRFLTPSGEESAVPEPAPFLEDAAAPSILLEGADLRLWYEAPDGSGIGYARFTREGDTFVETRRVDRVLAPTEAWENGFVGSPSVIGVPLTDALRMYYEGDRWGRRSIGYATSTDGITWVKRDPAGRSSVSAPGHVQPILVPSQKNWEFHFPAEPDTASVGTPHVILHRTPVRTLYYLFYTGNLRGTLGFPPDDQDTSIGMAISEDGLRWLKSPAVQIPDLVAWEVNPILNEIFALDVIDRICIEFFQTMDETYKERIRGSSNVFCPLVVVDEMAPCVLDLGTSFFLFFQQTAAPDQKGIALAVTDRLD